MCTSAWQAGPIKETCAQPALDAPYKLNMLHHNSNLN